MPRLGRARPHRPLSAAAVISGIQFDAISDSGYQAVASTYGWSHIWNGDFLTVDVALLSAGQTVSSITFNGQNLALIVARSTVTSFGRIECWGATKAQMGGLAPGTYTITVTFSGAIASSSEAVSYSGVHQTYPTEAANSNQGTNGVSATDATVVVTSVADNAWIHAAIATSDTSITANQTTRNNVTGAGGSGADEDFGPYTPAAAKTMSYTDVAGLATWALAGYAIRPVSAASLYDSSLFPFVVNVYVTGSPLLVISY